MAASTSAPTACARLAASSANSISTLRNVGPMSQLARPWPPPGDDDEVCSQPANTRVKSACTGALERCGGCCAQRRTGCPAPAVECALQVHAVKCAAGFALVLHALSCTLWLVLTVLSCRALQLHSTIMQPACTTLARTHCRTGCCQQCMRRHDPASLSCHQWLLAAAVP